MYKGFLHPLRGSRGGSRLLRGIARGVRSARAMRFNRPRVYTRSWCCCCPMFFVLGLAGLGLVGGAFYVGIRFLGWA